MLLTMVACGLYAGKVFSFLDWDLRLVTILYRKTNPISYYIITVLYAMLGIVLLYKSLLFIPSNREDLIEREGFDRRFVGLEKADEKVNKLRVLIVAFMSAVIILFVCGIFIFI